MEVRNQRRTRRPMSCPCGLGLVGLRERVELLGGSLRTSAEEKRRLLVSARIPA
ncbi:hypothetical protein [Nonomuraea rubra]|uniref:hypothetical protein n=1 Tax=Nonomuraea rubra TaxID=46180 RepID=UPI0031EAB4A0